MIIIYLFFTIYFDDYSLFLLDEILLRNNAGYFSTIPIEYEEFKNIENKIKNCKEKILTERLNKKIKKVEKINYLFGGKLDTNYIFVTLFGLGYNKYLNKNLRLTAYVSPVFKRGGNEYPTKVWRNVGSSDYFNSYVKLYFRPFYLSIGRELILWGLSKNYPILLSGNAPNFDAVRISYITSNINFMHFITILDQLYNMGRYFSAHKIEIKFKDFFIGFAETALYGGKDAKINLHYINPINVYLFYQWNRISEQVNILWSFYLQSKVFHLSNYSFRFYSEFMIDDIPYERTPKNDTPKIGINLGLPCAFNKNYCVIEWTAVTRWTYGHLQRWQRYTYLDYAIGHPLGNDFSELFFYFTHHLNKNLDIIISTKLLHKGEGKIEETYPEKFPSQYWLTGKIKTMYSNYFGISYYFNKYILTIKLGNINKKIGVIILLNSY